MTVQKQSHVDVERAVAYGLFAVVGGYAFVTAFQYGLFNDGGRVGPGLLPAVVGALVMAGSVLLLVRTLRGKAATDDSPVAAAIAATMDEAGTTADSSPPDAGRDVDIFGRTATQRVRQLWLVMAALVVALALVPVVGLLGALLLFSLFVSIAVERRPWLPSVIISLMSVVVIYTVFAVLLNVPLPTGVLGIGG